jgi:hypothetical protein
LFDLFYDYTYRDKESCPASDNIFRPPFQMAPPKRYR